MPRNNFNNDAQPDSEQFAADPQAATLTVRATRENGTSAMIELRASRTRQSERPTGLARQGNRQLNRYRLQLPLCDGFRTVVGKCSSQPRTGLGGRPMSGLRELRLVGSFPFRSNRLRARGTVGKIPAGRPPSAAGNRA